MALDEDRRDTAAVDVGGLVRPANSSGQIPRATYRLQLNRDFGFDDAAALAPYLADLGISHVYCSPYLKARPGSTHGYDIVSHTELNPDLGDLGSFDRMVEAFRRNDLGQILDFVPNHMGVGGADNPWWLDVLEWGRDSAFSGWFDIDWEADHFSPRARLLVPFLGEQYGTALESGALELKFDADTGAFAVWAYHNHKLPICPLNYDIILRDGHPALERLGDAFTHLSMRDPFASRAQALKRELAELVRGDPAIAHALALELARFKCEVGVVQEWAPLDSLIAKQHWRLAHFRVAGDEINYRRFFDVNDLARVRMELPDLFNHSHQLIFRLLEEGVLDGLRIDHIDGLLDPKRYCQQLREKAPRPFYLVVEKILAQHEELREDWGIDGTTGYEVANLITGLMIDPAGEEPLTRFYSEFTGNRESFDAVVRACKIRIMDNELASELNALAREIVLIARTHPKTADFTQNLLQHALKEIIAVFPVYRTYIDENALPTVADRRDIDWAFARARRRLEIDPSVFDFLYKIMTCDIVSKPRSGFSSIAVVRAAMRAQQLSGPVMAKGLEDTAFYRYNRLLALNEVGGHPSEFHVGVSAFHRANQRRARRFPHAMLSTSTHDSKRGEDTRARLAALSESPDEWTQHVTMWNRILRAGNVGSPGELPPDRNDEYAFYQLLLGSWPANLDIAERNTAKMDAFRLRIECAMTKTMREAKLHTTWAAPNAGYENATLAFVRSALDTSRRNVFLESFVAFQARIASAGICNSLIQTALKLTLPGVPDIYQGAELWDLNFVDPDNRRPVDYEERSRLLEDIRRRPDRLPGDSMRVLLSDWRDGRIKLLLVSRLAHLRKRRPRLFEDGSYEALSVLGGAAGRICAFARQASGEAIFVAVLLYTLTPAEDSLEDTRVALPAWFSGAEWTSVLDGAKIRHSENSVLARDLFSTLPVAVLTMAL
jgi:(1->4)-alpha-D-glucan 1-alpha-D-glucosylmutase